MKSIFLFYAFAFLPHLLMASEATYDCEFRTYQSEASAPNGHKRLTTNVELEPNRFVTLATSTDHAATLVAYGNKVRLTLINKSFDSAVTEFERGTSATTFLTAKLEVRASVACIFRK